MVHLTGTYERVHRDRVLRDRDPIVYWVVKYQAGLVWVVVGYWRDAQGCAVQCTFHTKSEALGAMAVFRDKQPGRYKLGRSPIAPPES